MSSPDEWSLTIPWEPWAKQRPRISKAVAGRPPRTHQPAADRKAEERTAQFLDDEWPHSPMTGNVNLAVVFYRSSRQVVDLDNLLKHFLDSANGILWVNDAQVTGIACGLHLDRENPRTTFALTEHDSTLIRDYS